MGIGRSAQRHANDDHDALVAGVPISFAPADQFPMLPADTTLGQLMSEGLRPDIAFVPFQMQRDDALADDSGAAEAPVSDPPALRCRNPFHLPKSSLVLRPLAHGAGRPPTAFTLACEIESLVPVRVSLHFMCNELLDDSKLAPDAASVVSLQTNSAIAAAATHPLPAVPSRLFPAGKHTYEMAVESPLDITGLTDVHLSHSHRLGYYPLVVQLTSEVAAAPAVDDATTRIACSTTYCKLIRSAAGRVDVQVVRESVRVMPSGLTYDVKHIYGRGEADEGRAAAAAAALPASASFNAENGRSADCVVCLCEPRDTAIFPCRHLCVCAACAQILRRQNPARCPVCRFAIEETLQIEATPV